MMGAHDALRFVKGMQLEPGREPAVREGLRERAQELRVDLGTLRGVHRLLAASPDADSAALTQLETLLAQWEAFCDFLEGPWEVEAAAVGRMLQFAGIRALTLRALQGVPGAHAALSTLAQPGSSFRFRGRRLAPPRCLFHLPHRGCLAGRWKPGKCANFFCSGEPNVLHELRDEMPFEDFVLANSDVLTREQTVAAIEHELALGRQFAEPKIILGADEWLATELGRVLETSYETVLRPAAPAGRYMLSSAECEALLTQVGPETACVVSCEAVDGAAVYELAIALDRHRAAGEAVAFILLAGRFAAPSALPHPLWADEEMSHPLGALDIYVVADEGDVAEHPGLPPAP